MAQARITIGRVAGPGNPKATRIYGCVFTSTWTNKAFVDGNVKKGINWQNLTEAEIAAFTALESAMSKLNGAIEAEAWICPIDLGDNVQIIERNGFGQNLPAIVINAEYPDGKAKYYVLPNELGGTKRWTADELYKYVKALYDNLDKGKPCRSPWPLSLVIPEKVDAILCQVPLFLWGAAAAYSGVKAYQQREKPQVSILWSAALLFAGTQFLNSGGLAKISGTSIKNTRGCKCHQQ